MKFKLLFLVTFFTCIGFSQDDIDKEELYKNYREDQFYASVTYNLLNEKPQGMSQKGFSTGFHFGFIRDMPINQKRDFAIGLGLGLSGNNYNQDMLITESDRNYSFNLIENDISFTTNKIETFLVEIPLEIRWRTSTAVDYSFWRVYAGVKLGYLLYNTAKFKSDDVANVKLSNIDAFEKLQYGLTLSAGYGTWNFHVYYGLNPIFKSFSELDGSSIDMKSLKIGLMFYIL